MNKKDASAVEADMEEDKAGTATGEEMTIKEEDTEKHNKPKNETANALLEREEKNETERRLC